MFSIIISEKGGAERREQYGQNEITIGRVKGNDLVLPKGNVSKRHARLIVRDGRYIVTDLKSTNGTYVNHRRITHATLVREGDRIYIGDFVLWLEDAATSHDGTESSFEPESSGTGNSYRRQARTAGSSPRSTSSGASPAGDQISHFPLEHDPDDSAPPVDLPVAPRLPTGLRARPTTSSEHMGNTLEVPTADQPRGVSSSTVSVAAISEHQVSSRAASSHPTDTRLRQHREALEQLISAVEQELGLDMLDATHDDEARRAIAQAVDRAVTTIGDNDDLPADLDAATLRAAGLAELLELGALGPYLNDDQLLQARVIGTALDVKLRGRNDGLDQLGFGTDASVGRILARLCQRLNLDPPNSDGYLDTTLENGKRLFAMTPQHTGGAHLIVLEGRGEQRENLEALVRSGTISRGMASLLRHCVRARANILVVGSRSEGKIDISSALASANRSGCTLWLHDEGHTGWTPADVTTVKLAGSAAERSRAITSACRIGPELIMVPPLGGADTLALLDAVTHGAAGIVLRINGVTARKALDRVATDMAAHRSALDQLVARQWLASSFDIAVEVTRLHDGRLRVVRIAELRSRSHGTTFTDIFAFAYHRVATGGSVEGAFYATGTVPRIVEDFAARGLPLDVSIFRRPPTF